MDDEVLLNEELSWRSRPGHRRRPGGANAIVAIGLVLTVLLWGVTAVVMAPMFAGPPSGDVVSPGAIVGLLVFGVEMLVASALAGRVWVAIGFRARSVLRPLGVLGPIPMLLILGFCVLSAVALVAGPFLHEPPPPTSGSNWRLVRQAHQDRYGVPYDRAIETCARAGEKIPTQEEIGLFVPPYPAGLPTIWLERGPDAKRHAGLSRERRVVWFATQPGQIQNAHVVCFRP